MTEMSSVESSVASSSVASSAAPAAAAGAKQDPVVPDTVVYVCSVVIVVMVVGGVIGLSILMKQRLDVNQNVTSPAPPGPGAPPPIAKLVSVEDSESNDFKVFNDDDPFHYRVAKARDGYHRKVPFYEAAHSKQKAKRHKKAPVTTRAPKPKKKAPAKKTTRRTKTTPKNRRQPVTRRSRTTVKHGKRKVNVAQNRELDKHEPTKLATPAAAPIREVGAVENIPDVGSAGVEIRAKKNAAKAARNTTIDGDIEKGDIHVSAKKKVSAKDKQRKALAETMKVLLKNPTEVLPSNIAINKSPLVPESVNLSDVSASETATSDVNATEHKAVIKMIKPGESGKPSKVDKAGSHNQTAPAAVGGSSSNGTTSNKSSLSDTPTGNLSIFKPVVSTLGDASLTDASSSRSKPNLAVGGSRSEETSLSFDESASYRLDTKEALSAVGSAAVDKSSPGAKSPVDVREENPPAKPSATNGSAAQVAPGAAASNPSVAQGSQSNNKAQTITASGASDKPSEALQPANGPPGSAPSGAEKKSAAADSAEKPLAVNTSAGANAVPSGAASDIGSPAKKEAAAAPENAAPHKPSSSAGSDSKANIEPKTGDAGPATKDKASKGNIEPKPGDAGLATKDKGDGTLPNQAVEEKHADKSKDATEHGADSLAPGPSAQRPLFCEARKAILRPLASYCTHILFGRLPLVATNGVTAVGDFDGATQEQLQLASVVRPGWPHVSLMTTLGGGGEKDDIALAKAFESGVSALDELAIQTATLVRKRGLDGLNVHWSVPDLEGDVEAYATGLVAFVKKLRKELGPASVITVVLPSEPEERNSAFNVRELQPLVNFLFVSTHDTFSPYSTLTHFNGPAQDVDTGGMFTAIADVMKQLNGNQSRQLCFTFGLSGVAYKVDADAPLAKYVPLVGSANTRSAQGAPNSGQQAKEGRVITYDQVCKLNLTCHKAHVEKSCYDKVGDTWYGYVDEEAVASKAKWILKDGWENLCVVAWNVDADDVKGSCRGDAAASYPLLRSLSQATAALAY
uniref:Chitinase n=1 Tax=Rhipicephalus appendiculatus TaxID=34631 RepID=A0A131YWS5_RHIAP